MTKNNKDAAQKRSKNPGWIRKNKEVGRKNAQDPEWRRKNKESNQKLAKNPEWQRKHQEASTNCAQNPEWRRKNKEAAQRRSNNLEWHYNQQEARVGGFWYGNVRNDKYQPYCELWNPDLFRRIDEAQNYQSILSGKTKEDNGGRALSRHHVYWQPKACCEWDEDAQGYYAWIDIGTPKHPNKIKYYIKGNPNKFVLLTISEHRTISRDKLKWIKIFEELIELKLGGVCYLPK